MSYENYRYLDMKTISDILGLKTESDLYYEETVFRYFCDNFNTFVEKLKTYWEMETQCSQELIRVKISENKWYIENIVFSFMFLHGTSRICIRCTFNKSCKLAFYLYNNRKKPVLKTIRELNVKGREFVKNLLLNKFIFIDAESDDFRNVINDF